MGIFNKQQTDQPYQDGYTQDAAAPVQPAPIDGVIAQPAPVTTDDSSSQFPIQSAPPLDNTASNEVGDYIMTDPPIEPSSSVPAEAAQDEAPANDGSSYAQDPAQEPTVPPADTQVANETLSDNAVSNQPEPEQAATSSDDDAAPITVRTSADTSQGGELDELATIKQEALKQLAPLVPHLDQSPEEKFHTAMMMLQATDDPTLVKPAYEAAQAIPDEKVRAQALLDIVNEINYFTQQKSS